MGFYARIYHIVRRCKKILNRFRFTSTCFYSHSYTHSLSLTPSQHHHHLSSSLFIFHFILSCFFSLFFAGVVKPKLTAAVVGYYMCSKCVLSKCLQHNTLQQLQITAAYSFKTKWVKRSRARIFFSAIKESEKWSWNVKLVARTENVVKFKSK